MQNDDKQDKQDKKGQKKLTLTVRNVETLETRATPNTNCPGSTAQYGCGCKVSVLPSIKLTAVAYF